MACVRARPWIFRRFSSAAVLDNERVGRLPSTRRNNMALGSQPNSLGGPKYQKSRGSCVLSCRNLGFCVYLTLHYPDRLHLCLSLALTPPSTTRTLAHTHAPNHTPTGTHTHSRSCSQIHNITPGVPRSCSHSIALLCSQSWYPCFETRDSWFSS
ncbi:hypothetical protein B0O80DRAFT_132381 [Mortierella sp. GBAus27b]|nr:hypothetical protein B0O80DRAFT_132381 [Mortierella sp. GBAus27b]